MTYSLLGKINWNIMTSKAFLMDHIRLCRTFERVEVLFVLLVVSLVKSQTDLRPRDVNVTLQNDFCLSASWAPPEGIDGIQGCEYEYYRIPKIEFDVERVTTTSATIYPMIEGGTMKFSLQTICKDTGQGERVVVNITTNPELVQGFQCALHSSTDANCSWTRSTHVPNLRLFYLISSLASVPTCGPLSLKECVIYPHPDNVKMSVCHMSEELLHRKTVYFLFNGTQDNMSVRNTFNRDMNKNVRPPALEWTLEKRGGKLNISWTPPNIKLLTDWEYVINYTQCNFRKSETITGRGVKSWLEMAIVPHCQYRIKLKATQSYGKERRGETPWSDEKSYGENVSPHSLMINAAIISLLLVSIISFLTFCAVRKYKEQIFPRVPEPEDFLKDVLDNKGPAEKLYVPAEETEGATFCLVLESDHRAKLDAEN